ncbi:MAG TPA: Rnase Y domain-containing protein [Kofleriaceae bacterium]|nr:Rnase Y domain-containing protein [Kofleriaceae bacterium]
MWIALLAGLVIAVIAAIVSARAAAAEAVRAAGRIIGEARAESAALVQAARLEAAAHERAMDTAARAEVLEVRTAADDELARAEAAAERRAEGLARIEGELGLQGDTLEQRDAQVTAAQREVQSRRDRAQGVERDAERKLASARAELEARAGVRGTELIARMTQAWLDEVRGRAAAVVRAIDATAADPAHDREARRVMEIAATRYQHHYLTERSASNLRIGSELVTILLDQGGALHAALERGSGVQLQVNDEKDAIRLDGLDGVGKELVRRAIHKFMKKPESIDEARKDPEGWVVRGREHLQQEIRALGKRAFQTLGIQKAHPEIVELVGALNFRTSYTQNQWWHAVEASYLAGMMAAELGLDEKLARRATLMHDIGKALTHKIEGSHAVIGADIARRLGEPEVVANAIGAHHADEPCNSVYAYLVAASDAMSGARPGARRELAEGFTAKIEDLERIGLSRRGVAYAHAVHGGRELRVYVREREVDDLTVVEMSTDIARQIAEEMTFPGQIKVTVIRAFEAVATAS